MVIGKNIASENPSMWTLKAIFPIFNLWGVFCAGARDGSEQRMTPAHRSQCLLQTLWYDWEGRVWNAPLFKANFQNLSQRRTFEPICAAAKTGCSVLGETTTGKLPHKSTVNGPLWLLEAARAKGWEGGGGRSNDWVTEAEEGEGKAEGER